MTALPRLSDFQEAQGFHWTGPEWVTCLECEGLCTFYSDAGPAPREIACDCCDGSGGWPADACRFDDGRGM